MCCTHIFRKLFSFCLALLLVSTLVAQPIIDWSRTYGGNENEFAYDIKQTDDQGFIVAGTSFSTDQLYDAWIVKLNNAGNVSWEQNFGGADNDVAKSIISTNDGGYIFTGYTHNDNGDADFWLVKIEANGELEWENNYGGAGTDLANAIVQTTDGGYIIAGQTNSIDAAVGGNNGSTDYWVLKIKATGEEEWNSTYGGSKIDQATSIRQTIDGGYIVIGNSFSFNEHGNGVNALSDAWVLKLSSTGEELWSKNIGSDSQDTASDIISSNDGGYVVVGSFSSTDGSTGDNDGRYDEGYWIFKLSANGEVLWNKTYGGEAYDVAQSITYAQDGGYIVGGYSNSEEIDIDDNKGNRDYWIVKLNTAGELEWQENYGGEQNDEAQSVYITNDGFVVAGQSLSDDEDVPNNEGHYDLWVMNMSLILPLSVNLGADINLCEEESVELIPSVGFCPDCSFLWNDGSEEEIREVTPDTDMTYSVTVTNGSGFTASDAINVFVVPKPDVSYTSINLTCFQSNDGLIDLFATGGSNFDFDWQHGPSTEDLTALSAGNYQVTVSNNFNCESALEINISQPSAIGSPATVNDISCHGLEDGTIDLNAVGGTGTLTYMWSNGEAIQDIDALTANVYTVTITDENECKKEDSFIIEEPAPLSIDFDVDPVACNNPASAAIDLEVMGGTGSYTYEWSNDANTQDLNDINAGTYWVTISDANECTTFGSYVVSSIDELLIEETVADISCNGDANGSISLDIGGGDGTYNYNWSNGGTTSELTDLEPGTYNVIVTDGNDCVGEASYTIEEPIALDIDLVNVTEILCNGDNTGAINIDVDGGVGDYAYSWNTGSTNEDIANLIAGEYNITVRDDNDCSTTRFFVVTEPAAINIDQAVTQISCHDGNDGAIDISVEGGVGAYTYSWSNDATSQDIGNLGTGTYNLLVEDDNNCTVVSSIQILEPTAIGLVVTNTPPQNGDDGQISVAPTGGTPPYSAVWEDGTTGFVLSNITLGDYTITVTDFNDCVYEQVITLGTVAVNEIDQLQLFELSPNPTQDIVNLKVTFDQAQAFQLKIYNDIGQLIELYEDQSSHVSMPVNLANQASGMYFFVLTTKEGIATRKLVLSK